MMGRLYTVSGPAGVGKGTLVDLACAMDPSLFLSISCTCLLYTSDAADE